MIYKDDSCHLFFFCETEFICWFFFVGKIFDFSKKKSLILDGKPNFNLVAISKYFIF